MLRIACNLLSFGLLQYFYIYNCNSFALACLFFSLCVLFPLLFPDYSMPIRYTVSALMHSKTCRIFPCCLSTTIRSRLWPRAPLPLCAPFRHCKCLSLVFPSFCHLTEPFLGVRDHKHFRLLAIRTPVSNNIYYYIAQVPFSPFFRFIATVEHVPAHFVFTCNLITQCSNGVEMQRGNYKSFMLVILSWRTSNNSHYFSRVPEPPHKL